MSSVYIWFMKLYIIGNGFDLAHGIASSYDDFRLYLEKVYEDVVKSEEDDDFDLSHGGLVLYEMISNLDSDTRWSDFETNLGKLDYSEFEEGLGETDSYERESLYSDLGEYLHEALTSLFNDWARSIDITKVKPKFQLDKKGIYLTFNYTMTLEKVYGIPPSNILHIHGSVSKGNCIIGHVEDNVSFKRYGPSEKLVREIHRKLRKEVEAIQYQNRFFFNAMQNKAFEDVFVLGHSLSKADDYYFEKLFGPMQKEKESVIHFLDYDYERNMEGKKVGKMYHYGFRGLVGSSVK